MSENVISEKAEQSHQSEDLFVGRNELRVSEHALREAHKEGLRGKDIVYAVLTGSVVERYPDRRRVLIAGNHKNSSMLIHVVCDYTDFDVVVVITVYIPNRPRWVHPLKRCSSANAKFS